MRRVSILGLLAFAFATWSTLASAQTTVTLSAQKDNTLYEDPGGAIGNGSGEFFFAGRVGAGGGGLIQRGLIKFDIAGGIPAGAAILDVKLTLSMSQTSAGPEPVELHRLLADWAEGPTNAPGGEGGGDVRIDPEATWIHTFSPASFWATPGGDFDAAVSATLSVDAVESYTWTSAAMVSDVQAWLDLPAANLGWSLIGREDTLSTSKRFDSRSSLTVANRPVLEVTYVIPTIVNLQAVRDNTLYEDLTGSFSNGKGEFMFAGRDGLTGGQLRKRAVVLFNVAAGLPAGAIVVDARLKLHMSKTPIGPVNVAVHRVNMDWGEGTSNAVLNEGKGAPSTANDATWLHAKFPGSLWSTAGGDFQPAPSATTLVDFIDFYEWSGPTMEADVQDMHDVPANNFGWLVLGDESTGSTVKRFDTRENVTAANRPVLTVGYYVPVGPCPVVLTGDVNVSGTITSSDIILMVNHVFKGGPPPIPCSAAGDVNCSGSLTSADIIGLVNFVFKGGAAPCDVCTLIPGTWSCP